MDLVAVFDVVYVGGVFEEGILVFNAVFVDAEGIDGVLVDHGFVHFGGKYINL